MIPLCDKCGKPFGWDDGRYTLADKFDDEGRLIGGRHWDCHIPIDRALSDLRDKLSELEAMVKRTKS